MCEIYIKNPPDRMLPNVVCSETRQAGIWNIHFYEDKLRQNAPYVRANNNM